MKNTDNKISEERGSKKYNDEYTVDLLTGYCRFGKHTYIMVIREEVRETFVDTELQKKFFFRIYALSTEGFKNVPVLLDSYVFIAYF